MEIGMQMFEPRRMQRTHWGRVFACPMKNDKKYVKKFWGKGFLSLEFMLTYFFRLKYTPIRTAVITARTTMVSTLHGRDIPLLEHLQKLKMSIIL